MIVSLPSIFIWPAMLVLSKLRKIPVILLLRDVEPLISFQLRGVDQAWWAKIVVSIFSKLYAFADGIVLVHESQRASLPFNFSNTIPIAVVDHGVDLDRMSPDKAAVCNLKLNKFRPDDIVVLYTGTFGVAQDLVAFLEAISSDEIKGLPFSFFFIGDGEQSARMAQLKKKYSLDRVIIHTPVSRHEVVSILDQADVLLMSYKKDSRHISGMIGSKFYEYCASGKPILVFGYGVASNLVESIGNGWRCDTGEVADLGMQLERIIKSHDRNLLGIRGREYARIHFDKKQRHRKWIQIIKDSLERR